MGDPKLARAPLGHLGPPSPAEAEGRCLRRFFLLKHWNFGVPGTRARAHEPEPVPEPSCRFEPSGHYPGIPKVINYVKSLIKDFKKSPKVIKFTDQKSLNFDTFSLPFFEANQHPCKAQETVSEYSVLVSMSKLIIKHVKL